MFSSPSSSSLRARVGPSCPMAPLCCAGYYDGPDRAMIWDYGWTTRRRLNHR
jgi:hypothetical protein